MLLHHYTTRAAVASILTEGLNRGEAPIGDSRTAAAINLTTDPDPTDHGLDMGGHVVTAEEARFFASKGHRIPEGTIYAEKRAVRLTVKLPLQDPKLKRWRPWSRKHCVPGYAGRLERAADGRKAKTWWLYFGVVPPGAIIAVDPMEAGDATASAATERNDA